MLFPRTKGIILLNRPLVAAPPALGTPAYIMHEVTSVAGGLNKTVNVPAGTLDGHVMIATMSLNTTVEPQTTDFEDHGWTPINSQTVGGAQLTRTYWKVASSEPASYTLTWSASAPTSVLSITTFEDVDTASPIDGTPSTNTASSTTLTGTGVTTSNDNTMLVQVGHSNGSRTYSSSTLTEIIDSSGGPSLGVFYGLQASEGASGNKTATISSSATWACTLIALRPTNGV